MPVLNLFLPAVLKEQSCLSSPSCAHSCPSLVWALLMWSHRETGQQRVTENCYFFFNYIFPELTWNLFNAVIEKKHQKWDEPCTMHEMMFINKLNLQQEALLKITIQIAIISFSLLFTLVIFIWSFIYCSCLTVLYVNEYIECFWIYICWT